MEERVEEGGDFLQVDASQETRLRTFAVEDRLMAVEAAVNRLHAVLVPGDKGQGAATQDTESKVRLPLPASPEPCTACMRCWCRATRHARALPPQATETKVQFLLGNPKALDCKNTCVHRPHARCFNAFQTLRQGVCRGLCGLLACLVRRFRRGAPRRIARWSGPGEPIRGLGAERPGCLWWGTPAPTEDAACASAMRLRPTCHVHYCDHCALVTTSTLCVWCTYYSRELVNLGIWASRNPFWHLCIVGTRLLSSSAPQKYICCRAECWHAAVFWAQSLVGQQLDTVVHVNCPRADALDSALCADDCP